MRDYATTPHNRLLIQYNKRKLQIITGCKIQNVANDAEMQRNKPKVQKQI
jgi:hypothetical protein